MTTESENKIIAEFMVAEFKPIDDNALFSSVFYNGKWYRDYGQLQFHSSWDWIHPVHRKIAEIGLWMSTHANIHYSKLWLEKSDEIKNAMLNEKTPQKAAARISHLIQWYNQNK